MALEEELAGKELGISVDRDLVSIMTSIEAR